VKTLNNEEVLKMINRRIDDLSKSYNVLNDSHQRLENGFIEMKTEWRTTKSWVKFIFGTSLLGALISLLTVLRTFGVI